MRKLVELSSCSPLEAILGKVQSWLAHHLDQPTVSLPSPVLVGPAVVHLVQVLRGLAQPDLVDQQNRVVENQLVDTQPPTLVKKFLDRG